MEETPDLKQPNDCTSYQEEMGDKKPLLPSQDEKGERGKSSLSSASFNVINSIIGSGIIGLPYAMRQAGFLLGMMLLLAVALINDYSIILLIKAGNLSGTNTYQALVRKTFGLIGYIILSILQFIYPFLAMVSYNIITGDTLTKVFQRLAGVGPGSILANRHFVIVITTLLFTLPLSLYRDISKLGKVSFLSLLLTLVILVIVVVRAVTFGPQIPPTVDAWDFAKPSAIQAVGVMSFAFICHHNSFLIYGSLRDPTMQNWSNITHVSVSFALLVSLVFAGCGYSTFTGYTQGDIFENYCKNDDLATFGRLCYAVSIVLTFPIECFVTREVISNVFLKGRLSMVFHIFLTLLIVAVCTSLSLIYDCLGIVLELNGVLSAIPLVFVIPAACYLKLTDNHWSHRDSLISVFLFVTGVSILTVGFTMTVLHPQQCSHGKEMFYCLPSNSSITNVTFPTNVPQAETVPTSSSLS
ncbi:putative sodium-coupled neutral amino acid transporter 11 isoform X1 [Erpetoichthys calabaricus]|uniref:putative sodium-coupled neutral amino acid transporter 11 isoform X1 n=2 Tax=Erpetoichthys calabaricus TaxID=27687 RepID=UPI002233FB03|nr:putative sodium-coupled neutral amino acid transporter 11 isoform X1 [Erpetoichthys calabaricus]